MVFRSFLTLVLVASSVSALGCNHSSAMRTGDVAYGSLPRYAPVAVFFDERAVNVPFQIIGQVETETRGRHWNLTVNDAIPELTARARTIGADGIIVDQAAPMSTGRVGTGIYARARAIRRVTAGPQTIAMAAPQVQTTVFVPPPQQVVIVAPPAPQIVYAQPAQD